MRILLNQGDLKYFSPSFYLGNNIMPKKDKSSIHFIRKEK